jgi:hypothetical protein
LRIQQKQLPLPYILCIYFKFDTSGQLVTRLYHRRDDFNFVIYQPLSPMEFIFQNSYSTLELAVCIHTFYKRHRFLSTKLLNQGFFKDRLILPFRIFFGRYQHLVEKHLVSSLQMTKDGMCWFNLDLCFIILF